MASRKSILGLGICAALAYAGFDWSEKHVELVTLHVSSGANDYDPQLFIVDDDGTSWIRAERPDRLWLAAVRANPEVVVHRGDQDIPYHAEIWNRDRDHRHVDALFRAKYGLLDRLAAFVWRRDAVPIRLDPPDTPDAN